MRAPRSIHLLLVLGLVGSSGDAKAQPTRHEEIHDAEHQYCLMQQDGFEPAKSESKQDGETTLLQVFSGPDDAVQTLSILRYPMRPAWRRSKAFYEQIEQGVAKEARGYKLLSSKQSKVDGVPALDLSFQRDGAKGKEKVWMRFLFHRRFGLVASAAAPAHAKRPLSRKGRSFVRSLRPWFGGHL